MKRASLIVCGAVFLAACSGGGKTSPILEDLGTLPDVAADESTGAELPAVLAVPGAELWVLPDVIPHLTVEEWAPEGLPGGGRSADTCTGNEQCTARWSMAHSRQGACPTGCETERA